MALERGRPWQVEPLLRQIFHGLRHSSSCLAAVDAANTIHLQIAPPGTGPQRVGPAVAAHLAPVFIVPLDLEQAAPGRLATAGGSRGPSHLPADGALLACTTAPVRFAASQCAQTIFVRAAEHVMQRGVTVAPPLVQVRRWDLTLQKLVRFIDGTRHAAAIAQASRVDLPLVLQALQALHAEGWVRMLSVFTYANHYACTAKIHAFARSGARRGCPRHRPRRLKPASFAGAALSARCLWCVGPAVAAQLVAAV